MKQNNEDKDDLSNLGKEYKKTQEKLKLIFETSSENIHYKFTDQELFTKIKKITKKETDTKK